MVTRTEPLSIIRQCDLLDLPRSTFYHVPKPISETDLELMKLIDRCHMELPFYGSRRMVDWLGDEGHLVNRKRVQRLMRTMGIVAIYPKKNLSQPYQAHRVYPYLLRNLNIDRPTRFGRLILPTVRPAFEGNQGCCCRSLSMSGMHPE